MHFKALKTKIVIAFLSVLFLSGCTTTQSDTSASQTTASQPVKQADSTPIWPGLRRSFTLRRSYRNPEVQKQIHWFMQHPKYVYKLAVQSKPYLYYIKQQVKQRGLPGELALIPMIESAYNPFAYSGAGAAGLWQIMPGTGTGFGVKQDWWYDGRRDIHRSTKAALDYLFYLHNFFDGRWLQAIAAYDSGEGTVQNAIRRNQKDGENTDFWHLKLPRETEAYVPRLLALAAIISHPSRYPIQLPKIPNEAYFQRIDVGSQIDLTHAAKLAGISLKELYRLNPGYNRWATDPSGPYAIVLPIDAVDKFKTNLAKLPNEKRVTWLRHAVKSGDSLSKISHRYHSSLRLIKEINKLASNTIRIGQVLLIPKAKKHLPHSQIEQQRRYITSHIATLGPQKVDYTVKHRDTYSKIAKRYHTQAAAIRFWNHLKKNHGLRVGEKLIIWTTVNAHEPHRNPAIPVTKKYVIKSGDNVIHIAKRLRVSIQLLKDWNPGINTQKLKVGQRLTYKILV